METKYIQEIKYQTKMLNNLKRWLRNLIIFSSLSLVLIIFGPSVHFVLRIIGIVFMILSIIGCLLVGLGYKNGKDNVLQMINQMKKGNVTM